MKKLATIILMAIAALATTPSLADTYNVRDFGATGDGVHIDSEAINKAIRAATNSQPITFWKYDRNSLFNTANITVHLLPG